MTQVSFGLTKHVIRIKKWLQAGRENLFFKCAFAVVAVVISLFAREYLSLYLKQDAPLLVFLMAVVLSAWFGGMVSGIVATIIGAVVGTYFFIEPLHSFFVHDTVDQIRLLLYLTEGSAFSLAIGTTKRALANETKLRQQLQATVLELTTAKQAELNAVRTKTLFLSNLSHEIRTPLGAITGFIDLLNEPDLSVAEKTQYLQALQRNSRFLSKLIDSFLDLSKAEAGFLDIEISKGSTAELIKAIREMFKHSAELKGIRFEIVTRGPIHEFIYTDQMRLRQILMNIVGNAIKFTTQGYVRVVASMQAAPETTTSIIQFKVEDTGPGLSDEQRDRLFQPFSQGDGSTFRKFGGSGLGLFLARSLALRLGGDVVLERSAVGVGSVFVVTVKSNVAESSILDSQAFESSARADLSGLSILVVDDSPDNHTVICRELERMGAATESAGNGAEAVVKAMAKKFDLILMDVQMPEMDGYEATGILRGRGIHIPIIALTAHASTEARSRAEGSGCSAYMTKPIDFVKLSWLISKEIGKSG